MSLKNNKIRNKSLSWSIAFTFTVLIFAFNSIILISLFFLLRHELAVRDKTIVQIRYHEVAEALQFQGLEFFQKSFEREEFSRSEDMLIRILDQKGNVVFNRLPNKLDSFDFKDLEHSLSLTSKSSGSGTIASKQWYEETIELYMGNVGSYHLLVGISTESSEEFMNLYFKAALALLLISGLLSIAIGYLHAKKALLPVRDLIEILKTAKKGTLTPVANVSEVGDELSELTQLFNDMIEQINKLIQTQQQSLDAIAHDLRTPITHLVNRLESLVKAPGETIKKEIMGELLEETHSITTLLSTLLDLSQVDADSLVLNKTKFSLKQLVDECVDIYEFIIEEKDAVVKVDIEDIQVFADRNKFKRVIANLLDNSLKYSLDKPCIEISAKNKQGVVEVQFKDNGIGIPLEERDKIWRRLYRLDNSRTAIGMGLGLSYVKSIVEFHGWSISLTENTPKGVIFTIEIT